MKRIQTYTFLFLPTTDMCCIISLRSFQFGDHQGPCSAHRLLLSTPEDLPNLWDEASGCHYGALTCGSCKVFLKEPLKVKDLGHFLFSTFSSKKRHQSIRTQFYDLWDKVTDSVGSKNLRALKSQFSYLLDPCLWQPC